MLRHLIKGSIESVWMRLLYLWLKLDKRYCRVVAYFTTTAITTIITDFLAFLTVAFLIVISPICFVVGIYIFPWG